VRNEWGVVPGHEIVGRVHAVGPDVTRHRPGDMVGVGRLVESCRTCEACAEGEEQFCGQQTGAYGGTEKQSGRPTNGGYSAAIVVDQHFVLKIPAGVDPARAAPLLCAGITTYSPLRYWKVAPGQKVGVVGLGGLGHMGVKFAKAMGARVVVFTTSPAKVEAAKALGADEVVVSTDRAQMKPHGSSFHFILNTVSVAHDLDAYERMLRNDVRYRFVIDMATLPKRQVSPPCAGTVGQPRPICGKLCARGRKCSTSPCQPGAGLAIDHGSGGAINGFRPNSCPRMQASRRPVKAGPHGA
jgi:uncharacterized zinc-type alcohol dehydrogenase-like protein